jgi:hypothetical protein
MLNDWGVRHAKRLQTMGTGARRNMKIGKTVNLEPPAPNAEKPEVQDAMGRPVTPRKTEVRLGREAQARIGQQLRSMYEEVVQEGVPQHINDLVRRLSEQDDGSA